MKYLAAKIHKDNRATSAETDRLHAELHTYFEQIGDLEATAYHPLCGQDKHLLEACACGIAPDKYWQTVLNRLDIRHNERQGWRLSTATLQGKVSTEN